MWQYYYTRCIWISSRMIVRYRYPTKEFGIICHHMILCHFHCVVCSGVSIGIVGCPHLCTDKMPERERFASSSHLHLIWSWIYNNITCNMAFCFLLVANAKGFRLCFIFESIWLQLLAGGFPLQRNVLNGAWMESRKLLGLEVEVIYGISSLVCNIYYNI